MPRRNGDRRLDPQPQHRAVEQLEAQLVAQWREYAQYLREQAERDREQKWAARFRRDYGNQ